MKNQIFIITGIATLFMMSCGGPKKITQTTATGETREEFVAPCLEFNENTKEFYRATASATSPNLQFAKDKATGLARNALAQKIEISINGAFDNFANQYNVGNKEEFKDVTKNITAQVVDQMLSGINVVCEKNYTLSSGKYEVWVGIEMPVDNVGKSIYDKVADEEKIKMDYEYEKFKEEMIKEIERRKEQ